MKQDTHHISPKNPTDSGDYYSYPNGFLQEGVDHINISVKSVFFVGRLLSPEYHFSVKLPVLGRFRSVYALWAWVIHKDAPSFLRKMKTGQVKRYRKSLGQRLVIPHFKWLIIYSTWIKIQSMGEGVRGISNTNELKLIRYQTIFDRNSGGTRIAPSYSDWFVPAVQYVVDCVRENKIPELDYLADKRGRTPEEYLQEIANAKGGNPVKE